MFALVLISLARSQPPCPAESTGDPNGQVVTLGYHYDYSYDKNLASDFIQFQVESGFPIQSYVLWLTASKNSDTALTADLYPRLSVNVPAANTSAGYQFSDAKASLALGSVSIVINLATVTFPSNGTNVVFITFFAGGTCETCHTTIDFGIDIALLNGFPSDTSYPGNFAPIMIINNRKSIEWEACQGQSLVFWSQFENTSDSLFTAVTLGGYNGQAVLYWQQGIIPNTSCSPNCVQYPNAFSTVTGSYSAPAFTATTTGVYYLSVYLKTGSDLDVGHTCTTAKFGWNGPPCSSASTASLSVIGIAVLLVAGLLQQWSH